MSLSVRADQRGESNMKTCTRCGDDMHVIRSGHVCHNCDHEITHAEIAVKKLEKIEGRLARLEAATDRVLDVVETLLKRAKRA